MRLLEYILNLVAEEGAEVAQAAAKANRFGINSVDPKTGESNKAALVKELNDLRAVVKMLDEQLLETGEGLVGLDDPAAIEAKIQKVMKWAKRSVADGTLEIDPA